MSAAQFGNLNASFADLRGKTAVITGGSTGIGFATAKFMAEQGMHVFIAARKAEDLEKARKMIDGDVTTVTADVSDLASIDKLFTAVKAKRDRIDFLFANAGIAVFCPAKDVTPEFFEKQVNVNLRGAYFTFQKALPLLGKGSSVVFNTSVVSHKGFQGSSVYAATKAGIRSLVRTFAAECAPQGIRVNAVAPGPIDTPIFDKMGMSTQEKMDMTMGFAAAVPMGRLGNQNEVAQTVAFLASNASSYITGVELDVDGGMGQV
jgi:NAD(P)-dependent dehydrogenase (short-subunit alcohol dehydrogenase family)